VSAPTAALMLLDDAQQAKLTMCAADVDSVTARMEALAVRTPEEASRVNEWLSSGKVAVAELERLRKSIVDPINAHVREVNAIFRPYSDAFARFEEAAKRRLLAFKQAERERIAREDEERRRRQEEAARQEAEARAKAEAARTAKQREKALADAARAAETITELRAAPPEHEVRGFKTDTGTTSTRMKTCFRVVDESKVPDRFWVVDQMALRRAVAEGAQNIPGVEIWEEETLATRVAR
jgi:hypothetical protein